MNRHPAVRGAEGCSPTIRQDRSLSQAPVATPATLPRYHLRRLLPSLTACSLHSAPAPGPNDGLTLLPDIVAPNNLSILSPTTDHFFAEDPEIDRKTLALLVTIVERIQD